MIREGDKLVIRSWSAVVARGLEGSPAEVVEEMKRASGYAAGFDPVSVGQRMLVLKAQGQLPDLVSA